MKYYSIVLILLLTVSACHTTKLTFNGTGKPYKTNTSDRDGLSYAKAVIIEEKNEGAGVAAEYKWLDKHYPGYDNKGQSLVYKDSINYDIIKIKTVMGKDLDVYFDIDNFFGRF